MNMTHYMELLAVNQPWNLIIYMAIPLVLAETVAISELYILFNQSYDGTVRSLNRWASILVGLYFAGIFAYLLVTAVLPITQAGAWRGPADMIAVGAYLLGALPLVGLALLELGVIGKDRSARSHMALHASFVGVFLLIGHVAMIFGMLDPAVLGAMPAAMHAH